MMVSPLKIKSQDGAESDKTRRHRKRVAKSSVISSTQMSITLSPPPIFETLGGGRAGLWLPKGGRSAGTSLIWPLDRKGYKPRCHPGGGQLQGSGSRRPGKETKKFHIPLAIPRERQKSRPFPTQISKQSSHFKSNWQTLSFPCYFF